MVTEDDVTNRPSHVPLVVAYGAGLNSSSVLIDLFNRQIRPDLIMFADTGNEKPATYAYLTIMQDWLRSVGFPPITTVKKTSPRTKDATLEDECMRRQMLPSRAFGFSRCALTWKLQPQTKYLNRWAPAKQCWKTEDRVIVLKGIDAGEAHRASCEGDEKTLNWYPLIEWGQDREECVETLETEGLPVPCKSACFFCPSSTKSEVLGLAKEYPELLERAIGLEQWALANTKYPCGAVKGLGRRFSWLELILADQDTRAALPEAPVESCLACIDESCAR